jgi:glycosyltransferase involved in cell wall biosynthesis
MIKPISVLQFTNSNVRAGAEEHMLMLLRGLDRRRFRLNVVCPPELARRLRQDLPEDVGLFPLDLGRPTQFGAMLGLARILRSQRVDILHSHMFWSSLFASPVGWLSRIPLIIETAHGREAWRSGWKASFFVDRCVGRCVDHYIAVSAANAGYLIQEKKYPARKVSVVHPGCDMRKFATAVPERPGVRRSLAFGESDPILVIVARLEPQKGHRILLEALRDVRKDFPNIRLVVAGEGSQRSDLESRTSELDLTDAVRFIGYPPDVREWLALATLTVLPSFHEGLPVTPIESLACGKPVVATAVDGTTEVVIDGKTGLTVPPGDPRALADAICRLLRNPDLARTLADEGRRWVLKNFSVEHLIERTEQFYLDHLENKQPRNKPARLQAHKAAPSVLPGKR